MVRKATFKFINQTIHQLTVRNFAHSYHLGIHMIFLIEVETYFKLLEQDLNQHKFYR